jgi:hypothetical protein
MKKILPKASCISPLSSHFQRVAKSFTAVLLYVNGRVSNCLESYEKVCYGGEMNITMPTAHIFAITFLLFFVCGGKLFLSLSLFIFLLFLFLMVLLLLINFSESFEQEVRVCKMTTKKISIIL